MCLILKMKPLKTKKLFGVCYQLDANGCKIPLLKTSFWEIFYEIMKSNFALFYLNHTPPVFTRQIYGKSKTIKHFIVLCFYLCALFQ